MHAKFIIPHKPYSVNRYHYGDGRKHNDAINWEATIRVYLKDATIQLELERVRTSFKASDHTISINLIFIYPKNILFNKEGLMSSRAYDLSNVEKPIIDLVFLERHSSPLCKNLELDDKYISKMTSDKMIGDTHGIAINIEVLPLESLKVKTL